MFFSIPGITVYFRECCSHCYPFFFCDLVGCQTLDVPDNGNVSVSTESSKTKAVFTCDTGYTLKGASVTICRSDGTWDFAVPTCGKYLESNTTYVV